MEITDKERVRLKTAKHKAVIRKEEIKEKVGDVAFEIDGTIYIVKEKKHWSLRRINAKRGTREFGCKTALQFRLMYNTVYDKYRGKSKELYWLIVLKRDEIQKTLGAF